MNEKTTAEVTSSKGGKFISKKGFNIPFSGSPIFARVFPSIICGKTIEAII